MELQNAFVVPVDIAAAWALLLDVERVAMCVPGATLESVDGDNMSGSVKVKLGPITMTYRGSAGFVERDDTAYRIVMDAAGKDIRGSSVAKAKVEMTLAEIDSRSTECIVTTDLAISGKPAQFGKGIIADVSARLIDQFAIRLAEEIENPAQARGAEANSGGTEEIEQGEDTIDLLRTIDFGTIKKPAAILIGVLVIFFGIKWRRAG